MIDTHCHLDMPAFDADRDAVWARARSAGMRAAIIPGVDPESWARTRACRAPGERFVALGIHPRAIGDLSDMEIRAALDGLTAAVHDAGAVAIGECGLDGAVDLVRASLDRQCRVFCAHVEIARALDLPLIVHLFRAHGDAMALLRRLSLPRAGGVLHSYSGSVELLAEYLRLGFHISFAGAVTRPNARRPVAALRAVPLDRLLLETDAPDQIPTGVASDSRRCEPTHMVTTATRIAELRNEPLGELVARTSANAIRLFRLPLDP